MKIGVSGDIGSFSEQVGLEYIKKNNLLNAQIVPLIDMERILNSLNNYEIDIGIFPIMNINSGLVKPSFEAMGRYQFKVIEEIYLEVEQCIFAKKLMNLNQIQKIYSYAPAFDQCKDFLRKNLSKAILIDWGDMAKAAKDLSKGIIEEDAVILGSIKSANLYNLNILKNNIQDKKPNTTIFIAVQNLESKNE